jgi:hypothetical protein
VWVIWNSGDAPQRGGQPEQGGHIERNPRWHGVQEADQIIKHEEVPIIMVETMSCKASTRVVTRSGPRIEEHACAWGGQQDTAVVGYAI